MVLVLVVDSNKIRTRLCCGLCGAEIVLRLYQRAGFYLCKRIAVTVCFFLFNS